MNLTRLLALAAISPLAVQALPQAAQTAKTTPPQDSKKAAPEEDSNGFKKYDEVVTKKAVSQSGMFKVHRIDDRILFEIPETLYGKEMLWQAEMAELPVGASYIGEGMGTKVINWSRRGKKIFLRSSDFSIRGTGDERVKMGVEKSNVDPILMSFEIQTEGKDANGKTTAVIDVTGLYMSDPADFSVRGAVGGAGVDGSRSYVDKVKAFPQNIETRSMLTFVGGGGGRSPFAMGGPRGASNTALVHYSIVMLPDKPMMGRYKDSRIGYFTQGFDEYGRPENRHVALEYIDRFRLEKKDPTAALSEPIQPIVFYIAREVPTKWREAIKKGIEDWKPAFEQAGFKNAIIAKDAPSLTEDPDWDPEDARYSVIRWVPSNVANAMGPSIQDPRSGETISAHVIFWNDVLQLAEQWYFSQAGAVDPKAHKIPFGDDLMKELMRYVASHEVGHTLGLEHNMKGSAWYTTTQLRDPKFTAENGVGCSIMDYSRFNYVAQPGDGVTRTIGIVGPYDKFAIEYGYKVFPGVRDADAEKPMLDSILSRQVRDPRVRFGNYKFSQDPTTQSEDIGSDAVEVGKLGFANIDRIAKNYLWNATTKFGEDYDGLSEARNGLISQRLTETFHVMRLLGGVVESDYHVGRGGDVFAPVPAEKQRRAALFLLNDAMQLPKSLTDPRITKKIMPDGNISEATAMPRVVLAGLLSDSRLQRMFDNEAANGSAVYTVAKLVDDITTNVFRELDTKSPMISVERRAIQRTYLDTMDRKINGSKTDVRLLAVNQLRILAKKLDAARGRTTDMMTQLHIAQSRADVENILRNKYTMSATGGSSLTDFFMAGLTDREPGCWDGKVVDVDTMKELAAMKAWCAKS